MGCILGPRFRLRNDLYCVRWGVILNSTHSLGPRYRDSDSRLTECRCDEEIALGMGIDQCQYGSPVDDRGLHSFVCRRAPGRSARNHALNDLVARFFATAGTPVTKEPTWLFRTDGKRPDGLKHSSHGRAASLYAGRNVHMPSGKITGSLGNVTGSACEAGAAAELAASCKEEKYASIGSAYLFAPIAVETLGPMNTSDCQLFSYVGRKISSTSGDDRERLFCSREFWCWCNATTLSCYIKPCQPLTARTYDLYPVVYYLNF